MQGTQQRPGHVLVVDDEPQVARAIALVLSSDHEVTLADDAADALERIARGERYDVILCDVLMPTISGADLYWRIREIAPHEAARIVFITGGAYIPEVRRFLDMVPNVCLEKPCDPNALRSFVGRRVRSLPWQRSALGECRATSLAGNPPSHVLVADDDDAERVVVASVLGSEGYEVDCVGNGDEALSAMRKEPRPALVLLDLMMPQRSGWEVLAAMADNPRLARVPVVVLTAFDDREGLPPGRHVLHKPVDAAVLLDLARAMLAREGRQT
jgi:CheY-like chemotaxis protein